MKRNSLRGLLCPITLALAVLFTTGCTSELPDDSGGDTTESDTTVTVTFGLTPELAGEVTVRSVDGANDAVISDLWVVQFTADGTTLIGSPQYIDALTPNGNFYNAEVKLSTGQPSRVCFVANTHDNTLYKMVDTETNMKSIAMTVSSESSIVGSTGVPMSGVWEGTPDSWLNHETIAVSLQRAVAKLTVKLTMSLPMGDTFTGIMAAVKNVPGKLHCYRYPNDPPTGSAYPALGTGDALITLLNTPLLTWYLPENARGTGTATTQLDKTAATAPAGEGNYCTYLEVKGLYLNESYDTKCPTTFRIYLGANNTTDYNVLRNTNYTLNVTIKGQYALDARMEIDTSNDNSFYTDNLQPWFVVAKEDAGSNMYWDVAMTKCPSGWRLPTLKELMLMYVYNGAMDHLQSVYWTCEAYSSTEAWIMTANGNTNYVGKNDIPSQARCIKTLSTAGQKSYPYVDGNTIVSRDADGGVKETQTQVPPKLEVASADAGTGAWDVIKCLDGWRLPNKQELMLMYVTMEQKMADALYWCDTANPNGSMQLTVDFSNGRVDGCSSSLNTVKTRCVKSVN